MFLDFFLLLISDKKMECEKMVNEFKKVGNFYINVKERICYYEVVKNEEKVKWLKSFL